MEYDYTLKAPFTMIVSGPSQSGKSTLIAKLIERRYELIDTPIHDVTYLYTEVQPAFFGRLKEKVPEIKFHKGLPEEFGNDDNNHKLIICDDLMSEMSQSKDALNLFVRGSHHRNISVIFLIQNFFYKNLRTLTTNAKYIILMKNVRDSGFASVLGRQMNANKKNLAMEAAWKDVCKSKYGYLVVDLDANQNDDYRFRSSLFPEEIIVYKSN